MTKLNLADGLSLPLEIVTERSAFIGRTGQGKSYAAQKLAELLHAAAAASLDLPMLAARALTLGEQP